MEPVTRRASIHESIFRYSLCGIALTLPFTSAGNSICIVILTLNWLIEGNLREKWRKISTDWVFWSFAGLYFLHVVGMIYTDNVADGSFQMEKKLSLLVLPLVIGSSRALRDEEMKLLLKCFLAAVIVASLICVGYAFHRNNYFKGFENPVWFYFTYGDLTEVIDMQPNYMAIFVCFAILILFQFLLQNPDYRTWEKLLLAVGIFYLYVFLLMLSARMPIVALTVVLLIGVPIYFWRKGRMLKGWLFVGGLVAGFLILVYTIPVLRERFYQTLGLEQQTTWIHQWGDGSGGKISERLLKWQCAWAEISDHWLIGVGPGDAQDALQLQYKKVNFDLAYNARFNPHNQFLQTWLALGIFGLAALVSTFVLPMRRAWRRSQYLYLSIILIFGACSLTESTLERQWGIIFFTLFNSIFAFSGWPGRNGSGSV